MTHGRSVQTYILYQDHNYYIPYEHITIPPVLAGAVMGSFDGYAELIEVD